MSIQRPSTAAAIGIVARREMIVRLRSRAYQISTAIYLLAPLAVSLRAAFGSDLPPSTTVVATTSEIASVVRALPNTEVEVVKTDEEVRNRVRSGDADAGVIGSAQAGLTVVADRTVPTDLVQGLSITPSVEVLDPNAPNPMVAYFVGLSFGVVYFASVVMFGSSMATSVVEEKQTRIVEILLATISARALLAGKLIGASLLAFAQIAVMAIIVLATGSLAGDSLLLDGLGAPLVWFVVLFTVAFIQIAGLYAATAATVSRTEDIGSATSPITMLVMAPYILVIVFNNNPTALAIMSYIPISAPVAVPVRLFLSTCAWWEPLASLAILILTTIGIILLAATIYSRSLLRTGKRVRLREVLRQGHV